MIGKRRRTREQKIGYDLLLAAASVVVPGVGDTVIVQADEGLIGDGDGGLS